MKLYFQKLILLCVLAAGLATSTTGRASGVVIGGQLYTPVNLKLVYTYYASNGQFKRASIANKDILLLLGYAKHNTLARGPGGDVFVLDRNTVMTDLTEGGFLFVGFNQLLYTETDSSTSTAFSFVESGMLTVDFYSDGGEDGAGGHNSSIWFEIGGAYTGKGSVSAVKNNLESVSVSFKGSSLTGQGFTQSAFDSNPANSPFVPVNGSVSVSGGGKVLASE